MIFGLVLAAGSGRRFGAPKADLQVRGSSLVNTAAEVLRAGGCGAVIAVRRPDAPQSTLFRTVVNPQPDRGMGSSLRLGIAATEAEVDGEACVVTLADLVGVSEFDVAAVIEEYRAGHGLVAARRGGHRSHPVLFSRSQFAAVMAGAGGDSGARSFLDQHADDTRYVDLPDVVDDIDTPEDLKRLG
jgi:CTP:molybdopterin cytidylyltransferase MocA